MKYLPFIVFLFYPSVHMAQSDAIVDSVSSALIVYESETQSESSEGGSGSSQTRNILVERVIGKRNGGIEIEYSFKGTDVPGIDAWKLPARVFIQPGSSIELLNEPEISARLENFLEKNPDIREQCGEVVFTWIAFEIHCSTNHVLDVINQFNLYLGSLSEGQFYEEPGALAPAPLKRIYSTGNNLVLQAELILDPKHLQAEYEAAMEQVAKITGESSSLLIKSFLKLSGEEEPKFSGKRLVTIRMNSIGVVAELQRETAVVIVGGGEFRETQMEKELLKRQPIK